MCGAACASEAGGGFEKPLLLCEAVFGGWLCVNEKAIFAEELEFFVAEEQRLENVGGCEGFGSSDFREAAVVDELFTSLGQAADFGNSFRAFVKANFERFFGSGIGVRRFLKEPLICGEFREELMGELVAAEVRVRRCEELAGGGLECGDIGAGEFEEFGGEIGVTGGERCFGDAELIDDLLPARGEPEPRSIGSKLCDLLERFDKLGKYGGRGFGECVGCGSGQEFAEKGKVYVATDPYGGCCGTEHGLKSAGGFRVDEASVFGGGEHLILVGVGIDREAQMAGCGEGGLGGTATGIRPADLLIIAGGHDGESFKAGLFGPVVNVAEDGELDESVAERQQGGGLIDEQQQVGFGKCPEEFADLIAEFRWLNGIGRGSTAGVQLKKFRELDAARQQESGRHVFGRGRSGALIGNRQDLQPKNDGSVGLANAFDTADGTENCVEFADGRTTAKFDGIEIRGATGECGGECSEERDSGR